jgi:hypothetical protein
MSLKIAMFPRGQRYIKNADVGAIRIENISKYMPLS